MSDYFWSTDKDQFIADQAARAFGTPILKENGNIECRWVKKSVSDGRYEKYFSHLPGYHRLSDMGGQTMIAFRLAAHEVDLNAVENCTSDEIRRLERH